MENIAPLTITKSPSWIEKHCKNLVLSVFSKIDYGRLEVVEGDKHHYFPTQKTNSPIEGKIIIHDISVYKDFVRGGSIGAAESFIAGKWSSPNLTEVIRIFAKAQQQTDKLEKKGAWLQKIKNKLFHWRNRNDQSGSKRNILAHYDLGNELYTRFLDDSMMYSSAIYPSNNASLADAQQHKLGTICQRLSLTSDDHLLEIGTGWGGLAIYAAQHYNCKVTTTTISDAQYEYAKAKIKVLGLEDNITLLKKDYRDLEGQYDKLVSIEMIEAVGYEFLPSFFDVCHNRLKEGGKMLIQSITIADQRFEYYKNNVDFIQRYIFPGGFLPSITVLNEHLTKHSSLVVESINDIGLDYAKTLADWRRNFLKSWPELTQFGYDEEFKRLWLYYFAYCEGAFLERSTSTVHLVARK
ncbi:cyclopropane-fatty-acyl-phospholipid synthase family protein [Colwellia sp. RSH04]|uniref:SAM-dependent methyltransferase n=1 Tax=Colwellia sp. RSH04 TaxID=2305464 RepID=UPI000E59286F|nr:cyclopropane-fatty-acyl-phospholipid synthase family protein [Colwellia sp. RSH04]RHW75027.1 class I SAM-dependent methyltransferase [Colwellia sp. RSH04]